MPTETANGQREAKHSDSLEDGVRELLKRIVPRKRRPEIAASVEAQLGRPFTKQMLDNFIAERKCRHRLPLSVAKAICLVLDEPSLRRYLNNDEDLALIQIGEHARANRKLLAQIATPKVKGRKEKR